MNKNFSRAVSKKGSKNIHESGAARTVLLKEKLIDAIELIQICRITKNFFIGVLNNTANQF